MRGPSLLRQVCDAFVCLGIAVVLFRHFEVEGYMISTGSMAPTLLGYHRQVTCPTCRHQFPYGSAFDESHTGVSASNAAGIAVSPLVTCPHCTQSSIDVGAVPETEGDQLLVNKLAFTIRAPRRWDVAVFRNPNEPTQAYVKRIVGLPGEAIQVRSGDVYINGALARKTLEKQKGMRILVYDQALAPPPAKDWQPRWSGNPAWKSNGGGFAFTPPRGTDAEVWSRLRYRHWVRSGGRHKTLVRSDVVPDSDELRSLMIPTRDDFPSEFGGGGWSDCPVRYLKDESAWLCVGVLSEHWKQRLLAESDAPRFREAILKLAAESHISPVTDDYGYNDWQGLDEPYTVRDLMVAAIVRATPNSEDATAPAQFGLELCDGERKFRCVFDVRRKVALLSDDRERPLRSVKLAGDFFESSRLVEFSLFDRRLVAAVDGTPIFESFDLPERTPTSSDSLRQPVSLLARGVSLQVDSLKLFRDVYYTRGRANNAVDTPFQLGDDDYFMLGDNSPVSSDSRSWESGAVPGSMLLGKPFVVHLPSRPGRVDVNGSAGGFRLPDPSRIRYIR